MLTNYELNNLQKGILIEAKEGFSLFKREPNETLKILSWYLDTKENPQNFSFLEKELAAAAIHRFSTFWENYFELGQTEAVKLFFAEGGNRNVIQ